MGSLLFSDFLHEVRVQLTDKNDGFGFQKKILIMLKMREISHFLGPNQHLNFFLNLFIRIFLKLYLLMTVIKKWVKMTVVTFKENF